MTRYTWIKCTRKEHPCTWCNERIPKGSAAQSFATVWEGDFNSGHFHPECAAAVDAVAARDGYWECCGDEARGRTDGDRRAPPMFLDTYRGGDPEAYRVRPALPVALPAGAENGGGSKS